MTTHYHKQLITLLEKENCRLRSAVIIEALEHEDIPAFFKDLLQYGCQSGIVSSMIYYTDTHKFFDKYYEEIETLRFELEQVGQNMQPQGDLKNWYAWKMFEETAWIIAANLKIV